MTFDEAVGEFISVGKVRHFRQMMVALARPVTGLKSTSVVH